MNRDPKGYLQDILERIARIETYGAQGREEFLQSPLLQDAILRNFEVIGEIVKRLGKDFTEQSPHIPWRRISGFRDVLIHDYEGVSMEAVWEVVDHDLPSLHQAIEALMNSLPEDDEG